MIKLPVLLAITVFLSHQAYTQDNSFQLPTNALKVVGKKDVDPLVKPLKVVAVIDTEGASVDRELEVWNGFMGSMDTDSIGFIFLVRATEDFGGFKQYWFANRKMDYPFFYDRDSKFIELNDLSEDMPGQTLILDRNNSVVLAGGSPMNTDPFNLYRSELHKRTTEMGIQGAVRGVIVEHSDRGVKWFYANERIFVNEDGERLTEQEAEDAITSKKVVPHISPLTDTVRLVRRNQLVRP